MRRINKHGCQRKKLELSVAHIFLLDSSFLISGMTPCESSRSRKDFETITIRKSFPIFLPIAHPLSIVQTTSKCLSDHGSAKSRFQILRNIIEILSSAIDNLFGTIKRNKGIILILFEFK